MKESTEPLAMLSMLCDYVFDILNPLDLLALSKATKWIVGRSAAMLKPSVS